MLCYSDEKKGLFRSVEDVDDGFVGVGVFEAGDDAASADGLFAFAAGVVNREEMAFRCRFPLDELALSSVAGMVDCPGTVHEWIDAGLPLALQKDVVELEREEDERGNKENDEKHCGRIGPRNSARCRHWDDDLRGHFENGIWQA